jgi:hypothetical protein
MLQHLYGIHLAEDTEEANQALGAFIDIYQDHPLLESKSSPKPSSNDLRLPRCRSHHNGRIEGTNNKLGVLKRIAYGFVNTANFAPEPSSSPQAWQHHHEPRIEGSTHPNARNQVVRGEPGRVGEEYARFRSDSSPRIRQVVSTPPGPTANPTPLTKRLDCYSPGVFAQSPFSYRDKD